MSKDERDNTLPRLPVKGVDEMAVSRQWKIRLFLLIFLLTAAAAGGIFWYVSYYTKTPDYAIQMIQASLEKHDREKFQKYVDLDTLLDGSADALMQGLIDTDRPMPEDARAAVSGFTKMFKAPLVTSFKGLINQYVSTGQWGSDESKAVDQGIPIDSDLVLEKSGLKEMSYRKIDYVAVDKEAGTAVAGVRVYQQEAADEFVLEIKFVQAANGVWRASEIVNFHDFIVFVMQARREHMQKYLDDTVPLKARHDKAVQAIEQRITDTLAGGTLGSQDTRSALKKIMQEEMVPEWTQYKNELSTVEVSDAAQTLQRLRLRICDLRIAYAEGYAAWMDDKKATTIREADKSLKQAKTLEQEAGVLAAQMKGTAAALPERDTANS